MDAHFFLGMAAGVVITTALFLFLEWAGRPSRPPQLPRSLREYRERKERW